jgi:hypothetical protein
VATVALVASSAACANVTGLNAFSRDDCAGGCGSEVDAAGLDVNLGPDRGAYEEEAGVDAAPQPDASNGGCGPVDTTENCGACGQTCKPAGASGATCSGMSCSYTCSANHSDCNGASGANTDGCECNTPGCCSSACQTSHSNGVGNTFYDCNAPKTFDTVSAMEACTAWAQANGGTAANCSDGWKCNNQGPSMVCYGNTSGKSCQDYCWGYSGSQAGALYACSCPNQALSQTWN